MTILGCLIGMIGLCVDCQVLPCVKAVHCLWVELYYESASGSVLVLVLAHWWLKPGFSEGYCEAGHPRYSVGH